MINWIETWFVPALNSIFRGLTQFNPHIFSRYLDQVAWCAGRFSPPASSLKGFSCLLQFFNTSSIVISQA